MKPPRLPKATVCPSAVKPADIVLFVPSLRVWSLTGPPFERPQVNFASSGVEAGEGISVRREEMGLAAINKLEQSWKQSEILF